MSPSKAYKKYVKRLASSGLDTCKATLANLAQMGEVQAFQWFLENRYQAGVDTLASDDPTTSFVASVLDGSDDEADEEFYARLQGEPNATMKAIDKTPASATTTGKGSKAKANKASAGDSVWRQGIYARYGITPEIGASFQSKHGTTFIVTEVLDDHIKARRA